MNRFIALAIAYFVLVELAPAREGRAPSLRELVRESEIIAIVDVKAVTSWKYRADLGFPVPEDLEVASKGEPQLPKRVLDRLSGHIAMLRIKTVISGDFSEGQTAFVTFHGNMICPVPPRFRIGDTALVFLQWDEDTATWRPSWGRHGVRTLETERKRIVYEDAIRQLSQIYSKKDDNSQLRQLADWYVNAIESDEVRSLATHDLADYRLRQSNLQAKNDKELPPYIREALHKSDVIRAFSDAQIVRIHAVAARVKADSIDQRIFDEMLATIAEVRSRD